MEEKIHEKTENKIIDLINQGAAGRLVIFKPEKSDKDLVIEKRSSYNNAPVIFLKIYVEDVLFKSKNFLKSAPVDNLSKENNLYLVFAYFDIVKQDIEDSVWIVPLSDYAKAKNSDFSEFLTDKKNIGKFLLKKLLK